MGSALWAVKGGLCRMGCKRWALQLGLCNEGCTGWAVYVGHNLHGGLKKVTLLFVVKKHKKTWKWNKIIIN